jgi:hypothetical protein
MGSGYVITGTSGGGLLKINTGDFIHNGFILVNGGDINEIYAPTGSGGGVNIFASGNLSGTGSIEARGGNNLFSSFHSTYGNNCGGGGRIAISALSDSSSFSLSAAGGDCFITVSNSATDGDGKAGTIYKNINGVVSCSGGDCPP